MPDLILLSLVALGVFALGALAQSVSGFGGSMVSIPLLLLLVDAGTAVAGATGVALLMSLWGWRRERAYVDAVLARRLVLTGLLGMPLGLVVLLVVDEHVLARGIGVLVLVAVALSVFRIHVPPTATAQRACGVLGGALLSSTGMNGPPLVLAVTGAGHDPRWIRGTLQAVFACQAVAAMALFMIAGVVGREALLLIAAGGLAVPLGWGLGDLVFRRLSAATFRWIVLSGLVAVAVAALAQSG